MITERPTPETDANKINVGSDCGQFSAWYVTVEFARRLERERDVARKHTKAWHGEYRALNDLHRELGLKHKEALRQLDEARENLTKACEDEHRMAQDLAILTVDRAEVIKQRDEAVQIAKKYEARYDTMSELRNNASLVALKYRSQRDRLLEALRVVLEDWKAGYRPEESGKSLDVARAAIAEVEGVR